MERSFCLISSWMLVKKIEQEIIAEFNVPTIKPVKVFYHTNMVSSGNMLPATTCIIEFFFKWSLSLPHDPIHQNLEHKTTFIPEKFRSTTGIRLTEGFNRQKDWFALPTKCLSLQQSGSLWLFCEPSGIIVVIILLVAGGYCYIFPPISISRQLCCGSPAS